MTKSRTTRKFKNYYFYYSSTYYDVERDLEYIDFIMNNTDDEKYLHDSALKNGFLDENMAFKSRTSKNDKKEKYYFMTYEQIAKKLNSPHRRYHD